MANLFKALIVVLFGINAYATLSNSENENSDTTAAQTVRVEAQDLAAFLSQQGDVIFKAKPIAGTTEFEITIKTKVARVTSEGPLP